MRRILFLDAAGALIYRLPFLAGKIITESSYSGIILILITIFSECGTDRVISEIEMHEAVKIPVIAAGGNYGWQRCSGCACVRCGVCANEDSLFSMR